MEVGETVTRQDLQVGRPAPLHAHRPPPVSTHSLMALDYSSWCACRLFSFTACSPPLQPYLRRLVPALSCSLQLGERRRRLPLQHILTGPRWRRLRPSEPVPMPGGAVRASCPSTAVFGRTGGRPLADTVVVADGDSRRAGAAGLQPRRQSSRTTSEGLHGGGEGEQVEVLRAIETALSVMLQADELRRQVGPPCRIRSLEHALAQWLEMV